MRRPLAGESDESARFGGAMWTMMMMIDDDSDDETDTIVDAKHRASFGAIAPPRSRSLL